MTDLHKTERFNQIALPHLDAAYNLAKWLTRNSQDAEDVVQESFIKAFRYFDGFRGDDGRAWLLAIVRNTSYTWLQSNNNLPSETFDENCGHGDFYRQFAGSPSLTDNPEQVIMQQGEKNLIDAAIQTLPIEFREVLVLRELEDFSYHEIATIVGIPVGTVMSRLARARAQMGRLLAQHFTQESAQ